MLLLTESHQPSRRLLLQMENIDGCRKTVRSGRRRTQIGVARSRSCRLQFTRPFDTIVDRLRLLDQLPEVSPVSGLCPTAVLISQILFHLLDIRAHIGRIRNVLEIRVTVQLDYILHETNQ